MPAPCEGTIQLQVGAVGRRVGVGLLATLMEHAGSLTQLVVGGLSGIIATSVLIAAGIVGLSDPPPPPPSQLTLVGCPGSGSVVAVAQPGEQMLVTGRSADGLWYRIYLPGPVAGEGWVRTDSIELLADGGALPVGTCGEVAAAIGIPASPSPSPTAAPSATPTAAPPSTSATASPTPTPISAVAPTPTAAPTPNVGPVFSAQPAVGLATIAFKPFGTGSCATSTSVTTTATDPDAVAQIQLWVKKPGAASFVRLSHDFVRAGSTWTNSINSAKDGIAAAGTLSYYGVAIDSKGATTTSKVKTIKVIRCDTEASINGGIDAPLIDGQREIFCSLPWEFAITDPDGLAGATIVYSIPPGTPPLTKPLVLKHMSGNVWAIGTSFVPHGTFTVTWTLTTTDTFGGTTTLSRTEVVHYSCVT
jgi:hypothetical protein